MLSDALSDFETSIQAAIIDLSSSLEFYEENNQLFSYGAELIDLINLCSLLQDKFRQDDALDLKNFAKLYKRAYSTRSKLDAPYWPLPIASTEANTFTL